MVVNDCFTLEYDTKISLSGGTSPAIKYTKPSGDTGSWSGTVSGTTIYYALTANDLDEVGRWKWRAYILFSGLPLHGKEVIMEVEAI